MKQKRDSLRCTYNHRLRYPEYAASRKSWGINALGSVVVEVEAADGTTGVPPHVSSRVLGGGRGGRPVGQSVGWTGDGHRSEEVWEGELKGSGVGIQQHE